MCILGCRILSKYWSLAMNNCADYTSNINWYSTTSSSFTPLRSLFCNTLFNDTLQWRYTVILHGITGVNHAMLMKILACGDATAAQESRLKKHMFSTSDQLRVPQFEIHSCFFTVQTSESDVTAFSGPRTVTEPEVWLSIKYLDTQQSEKKTFFSSIGLHEVLWKPATWADQLNWTVYSEKAVMPRDVVSVSTSQSRDVVSKRLGLVSVSWKRRKVSVSISSPTENQMSRSRLGLVP